MQLGGKVIHAGYRPSSPVALGVTCAPVRSPRPPCCMSQPEKLIGLALVESNFGLSLGHQKERAGVVYIPPREGTLAFSDRLMNHQLLSVFREKIFLRVSEGSKSFPL